VAPSSKDPGITSEGLSTKVIFLTAVAADSQIQTAITRGAKGIMLRISRPRTWPIAFGRLPGGRQWFPADVVDAAMERENGRRVQSKQLVQTLTPPERQVVVSLWEGNSNKMIARQLNLTEGTVKVHLSNIYNKLGVANRTALTARAQRSARSRDPHRAGGGSVRNHDRRAGALGPREPQSEHG
jgi:two-component system, NarL family, nitrate/nitrite response regulator NarL